MENVLNKCTFSPVVKAVIHTGSPNQWSKCIRKCLQMCCQPQNQGKDNDSTKMYSINAVSLSLSHTYMYIKTDTYPMSDTICSTMCLLKVMITNSFCWKTRERLSVKTHFFLIMSNTHKDTQKNSYTEI